MSPSMKKMLPQKAHGTVIFTALALGILLSACQPPAPTQSPVDISNQVATSVALTVAAQNAQTQAAQSAVPQATNTTLPTQTPETPPSATPILPTDTPTLIVLPTSSGGSGSGGSGTTVKKEYACNPYPRLPRDNTIFRPNAPFDIKWTIVNTGTKTMRAGLDVKYDDGTQMTKTTVVELPQLEPGDQYVVDLDAVAPSKEGTYTMTFTVEGGLCFPYVVIKVEK